LPGWTGVVLPELPYVFERREVLFLVVPRSSPSERADPDWGVLGCVVLVSVAGVVLAITEGVAA